MPSKFIPWFKLLLHALCLLPFLHLLAMYRNGTLAAQDDPVVFLTHFTGNWALWLLLASLAITPVRRLSPRLAWLVRFRRMVGLYAFFYATLHLLIYVFLFSGYDFAAAWSGLRSGHLAEPWRQIQLIWPSMLDDLRKRRFIQAGLLAWALLLALAVTSPQRVLLAMGGRSWQRLHRLVYLAGFVAIVHFWWQLKPGVYTPWKATVVLYALLLARLVYWIWKRWKQRSANSLRQPENIST